MRRHPHAPLMFCAPYSSIGGDEDMKRTICSVFILSFALAGVASAQAPAAAVTNGTHYTKSQLKQLVQDAHTTDQYTALSQYFAAQQKDYAKQAAEEKVEWIRRSQNVMVVAAKYPRPVDSARYLYEYYAYMAAEQGQLAAKYGQLAAPSSSATTN